MRKLIDLVENKNTISAQKIYNLALQVATKKLESRMV